MDGGDVENTTAIREKKLVEMPNYRLGKMTPIQSYLGNFEPPMLSKVYHGQVFNFHPFFKQRPK